MSPTGAPIVVADGAPQFSDPRTRLRFDGTAVEGVDVIDGTVRFRTEITEPVD